MQLNLNGIGAPGPRPPLPVDLKHKKEGILAMTTIRLATPQDTRGIHTAHMRSICEICSSDYTPEQIAAWGHRQYREDVRLKNIVEDDVWVVDIDGNIEGFGHLAQNAAEPEQGTLMALYFSPVAKGHGLGRKMYQAIEARAREKGIRVLRLESTITARGFYLSMGFVQMGEATVAHVADQQLPCFPMAKDLIKTHPQP